MTRVKQICGRALVIVGLLCAAPSVVVGAEFVEFYKNGIAATESQNWSLAADMMQKAIDQQPEAKTRIKKALYFRRYLPHFYLGKARFEGGDCAGARLAWQESELQGVVQRFPEFAQIQEGRNACSQMVDLQSALNQALGVVKDAEATAAQARRKLSELSNTDPAVQTLLSRQTDAEASLGRVRQRLASPDIVLSAIEEAATIAAVTETEFEAIGSLAAELRMTHVEVKQEELTDQVQASISLARRQLRDSEYLQPYPTTIARRRSAVEQALERARAADGSLSSGELEAIQSELTRTTRDLRRAVAPPPAELTAAAEAYLARDYAGVLTLLGDAELTGSRATSHSHLLQAAALFALYSSTGARDEAMLEEARQEVLACRSADPKRSAPSAVFSPSFVAFFENQSPDPGESNDDEGADEGP